MNIVFLNMDKTVLTCSPDCGWCWTCGASRYRRSGRWCQRLGTSGSGPTAANFKQNTQPVINPTINFIFSALPFFTAFNKEISMRGLILWQTWTSFLQFYFEPTCSAAEILSLLHLCKKKTRALILRVKSSNNIWVNGSQWPISQFLPKLWETCFDKLVLICKVFEENHSWNPVSQRYALLDILELWCTKFGFTVKSSARVFQDCLLPVKTNS